MKELLDIAGSVLYIFISIAIFPLMVFTQCLLETWAAARYAAHHQRSWRRSLKKKWKGVSPLPHYLHLAMARIKSLHW